MNRASGLTFTAPLWSLSPAKVMSFSPEVKQSRTFHETQTASLNSIRT